MVTFLSGGTGTPKLLDGLDAVYSPAETTVVANTGDDVELGGHLVCPDVDTLLYQGWGNLDRETWWGIAGDTTATHDAVDELRSAMGIDDAPRYLPEARQTAGREIAAWRRFSGLSAFMEIGDRDRAVHLARTALIDEGLSLSEATARLADALGLAIDVLPMSDDPVATLIHTPEGTMHFQEFWVHRRGEPPVQDVEFRGAADATPAPGVLGALEDRVVIGPSNPVTSIGPIEAVEGVREALEEATVVAVSPFLGDEVFSGPAAKLMEAVGTEPSSAGLPEAYPYADAFVLDDGDETSLDRPVVRTDIRIDDRSDAEQVLRGVDRAFERVT